MSSVESVISLSAQASASLRRAAFIAPLLGRLTVGVGFAESGWGKLHNLESVAGYFGELGIPAPAFNATFVSSVELICGTLLVLGLATRLCAVPLIGTMVVALITAKASDIASFSDLIGTLECSYAVLCAWLALEGPGSASIDHVIARRASARLPTGPMQPTSLA